MRTSDYTQYHPKWYRRPVSVFWWLESWSYARFVLRELTSVGVAFFAAVTLWQVWALGDGEQAYVAFQASLASPFLIALHVLALVLVVYHSITWFNLAPTAMAVRIKGKKVPDVVIAGANYAAWVVLSAGLAFILMRGL
jgi:fumarate reductase subunit C